jgi:dinuclear metal center YbgI/SA1388 family protein
MPSRAEVFKVLSDIAPLALAESWDNVGLLVDPPAAGDIQRILLTIDLTEDVLEEALEAGVELIVAYHPPIFKGLKRLQMKDVKARIVLRALAANISIYSPHTALDAAPGGLCDWLLEPFGALSEVRPITPATRRDTPLTHGLLLAETAAQNAAVRETLSALRPLGGLFAGGRSETTWAAETLQAAGIEVAVQRLESPTRDDAGGGRRATLTTPMALDDVIVALKKHLDLPYLRVAAAASHLEDAPIRSVAVCPGAGGSLFESVRGVDLLLTGEMRHHDILAHRARGASVILTDHTNTERGYLPRLAARLSASLEVDVQCSQIDADPLIVA